MKECCKSKRPPPTGRLEERLILKSETASLNENLKADLTSFLVYPLNQMSTAPQSQLYLAIVTFFYSI